MFYEDIEYTGTMKWDGKYNTLNKLKVRFFSMGLVLIACMDV